MLIIIFAFIIFYAVLLIIFAVAIAKLPKNFSTVNDFKSFSIIIPFKNESKRIKQLLHSLGNIKYDTNLYEIIFVNDHSTDNTKEIINSALTGNYRIIDATKPGKKYAMAEGAAKASKDYFIFTDADTYFDSNFLKGWNNFIQNNPEAKFTFGNVVIQCNHSFLSFFQQTEFAVLQAAGIASVALKSGITGSAGNMCIEKSFFKTIVGNIEFDIPSGDDMFLLFAAKNKDNKATAWNYLPESTVFTQAATSFRSFIRQRIRWTGKGKFFNDFTTLITGFLVYGANLSVIVSLFCYDTYHTLMLFIIKILPEIFLLYVYKHKIEKRLKISIIRLLLFAFVYPFYVTILIPAAFILFGKKKS